jgi:hypothetical protein
MAAAFLLELNHGACANLLATGNRVPFVTGYLATGGAILVVSLLVAPTGGIVGLVLANGLCQLVYNNWKWPVAVARLFDERYLFLLRSGFAGRAQVSLP